MTTPDEAGQPSAALRTDLIPQSPNAAELGKFGIIPVSLYTGIPDISIPLGEAKGRDISIPVTLNYHYNGMRPGEEASSCGLGWVLSSGVVTRVIRDKVDEQMASGMKYQNVSWRFNTQNALTQGFLDDAVERALYDTEPDIYAFSFAGYSGKFTLINGKITLYPYQKLRVSGSVASGFVFVTEDGTLYRFDQPEYSEPKGSNTEKYTVPRYISSWFLSTVYPATGRDTVRFVYSGSETVSYPGVLSQLYSKVQGPGNSTLYSLTTSNPNRVGALRLERIVTSAGTVEFLPGELRRDIDGTAYTLSDVLFKDTQGTVLKWYKFHYGYFGSSTAGHLANSLKLTGIDLVPVVLPDDSPALKADTGKYLFGYLNEGSPWPNQVLSPVDHWGYLNGYGTVSCLIPIEYYAYGTDRSPRESYTKYGLLNKITYPTGGSTVFDFEPNIYNSGVNPVYDRRSASATVNRTVLDNTTKTEYVYFHINTAQTASIYYSRVPVVPVNPEEAGNRPEDNAKNTAAEITVIRDDAGTVFTGKITFNYQNTGMEASLSLTPGDYTMMVQCDPKELSVTASVGYAEPTGAYKEGDTGPGLRIRSITSYPGGGQAIPALKKEYGYKDYRGISTGVLYKPVNYDIRSYTVYESAYSTDPRFYLNYSSSLCPSLGSLIDQDMYYSQVTEKTTDYTNAAGPLISVSEFNSPEQNTGVYLARKTDYKTVNGISSPVLKKEYSYGTVTDTSVVGIRPYLAISRNSFIPQTDPFREYGYDTYMYYSAWRYLQSEREVNYPETDSVAGTVYYEYDPRGKRNMVTAKRSRGNDQFLITQYKYPESYTAALMSPLQEKGMYSAVIEQQDWVQKSPSAPVLVSGKITEYDPVLLKPRREYLLNNAEPLSGPDQQNRNAAGEYTSLISDSRYESRIEYDYDPGSGNLISQDMSNSAGEKQLSYIWGYNRYYPVAEVKNALPSAIAYTGFESGDSGNWYYSPSGIQDGGKTGSRSFTGTVSRQSLPGGDYTVVLWARGSSSVSVNGIPQAAGSQWKRYEWQLNNTTAAEITANGNQLDDICLYPRGAEMSFYTYRPLVGLTSTTDGKGQSLFYHYDALQRLYQVKDEQGNIVKDYSYHYRDYSNSEQSRAFFKNNCSSGSGSQVTYTVPAGKYVSEISQEDADGQALAEINANGQNYANQQGICVSPVSLSYTNSTSNNSAAVTTLRVKDLSGNPLYEFDTAALKLGQQIPQGKYVFELVISGPSYNPGTNTGWGSAAISWVSPGLNSSEYINNTGAASYITGTIDLSSASQCSIKLLKIMEL